MGEQESDCSRAVVPTGNQARQVQHIGPGAVIQGVVIASAALAGLAIVRALMRRQKAAPQPLEARETQRPVLESVVELRVARALIVQSARKDER